MKKIVVALGGNALGKTPKEQLSKVKHAAKAIVSLVRSGNNVVIAHGNGPQVGMINLSFETSNKIDNHQPAMPFPECGAMSQGYIGYHLQNAISAELKKHHINKEVATIITQVEVDKNDPAFQNPTKPIGNFYDKMTSEQLAKEKGYDMIEDSGRGYRRVVPSPKPLNVVEINVVKTLIDAGHLVITVGGGGIPVIKKGNEYIGVAAVIDKDFASSKVAELLDSDVLLILTAINKVKINFNTENEYGLDIIKTKDLEKHIESGAFMAGSMLPKILAAKAFVEGKKGRIAIIAELEDAEKAIEGNAGTKIIN